MATRSKRLKKKRWTTWKKLFFITILFGVLLATAYVAYLDFTVRVRFEGKRFALPARVYARPLELYPGLKLRPAELLAELSLLGYRETSRPGEPGSYHWRGQVVDLATRPFDFGNDRQESMALQVIFDSSGVKPLARSALPV